MSGHSQSRVVVVFCFVLNQPIWFLIGLHNIIYMSGIVSRVVDSLPWNLLLVLLSSSPWQRAMLTQNFLLLHAHELKTVCPETAVIECTPLTANLLHNSKGGGGKDLPSQWPVNDVSFGRTFEFLLNVEWRMSCVGALRTVIIFSWILSNICGCCKGS